MPTNTQRKDVLKALEARLDYYSARAVLADLAGACGLAAADSFSGADVAALVGQAEASADRSHAKASVALREAFGVAPPAPPADAPADPIAAAAAHAAAQAAQAAAAAAAAAQAQAEAERAAKETVAAEALAKAVEERTAAEAQARADAARLAEEKAAAEDRARAEAERAARESEAAAQAQIAAEEAEVQAKAAEEEAAVATVAATTAPAGEPPLVVEGVPGVTEVDAQRPLLLLAPGPGYLHWGVNEWKAPPQTYVPGATAHADEGEACRTPLVLFAEHGDRWGVLLKALASEPDGAVRQLDFTFQFDGGSWWGEQGVLRAAAARKKKKG